MFVLKSVLLATLAAVTIASTGSAEFQKAAASGTGVSTHHPGGTHRSSTSGGEPTGSNEYEQFLSRIENAKGDASSKTKHDKPEEKKTVPVKHGENHRRAWSQPTGASASHSPHDASRGDAGSHEHGGEQEHRNGHHEDASHNPHASHTKHQARTEGSNTWFKLSGAPSKTGSHDGKGFVAHTDTESHEHGGEPKHEKEHGAQHNHHQARAEGVKTWFRQGDKGQQGDKPEHERGDADGANGHKQHQAREASQAIDLDDNDPMLVHLREMAQNTADDGNEHEPKNKPQHPGHRLDARGAPVYGIYECSHINFTAPCRWTQLKSETQCYNS